jgi:hypothetical protein
LLTNSQVDTGFDPQISWSFWFVKYVWAPRHSTTNFQVETDHNVLIAWSFGIDMVVFWCWLNHMLLKSSSAMATLADLAHFAHYPIKTLRTHCTPTTMYFGMQFSQGVRSSISNNILKFGFENWNQSALESGIPGTQASLFC